MLEQLAHRRSPAKLETTSCPDPQCGLPAEIEDRWSWGSTGEPVEMVKVRCACGRWYTVLAADLPDHGSLPAP